VKVSNIVNPAVSRTLWLMTLLGLDGLVLALAILVARGDIGLTVASWAFAGVAVLDLILVIALLLDRKAALGLYWLHALSQSVLFSAAYFVAWVLISVILAGVIAPCMKEYFPLAGNYGHSTFSFLASRSLAASWLGGY
jgi:hypothetical protein